MCVISGVCSDFGWGDNDMELSDSRHVPASHGWLWVKRGWAIFKTSPVIWVVLILAYMLLMAILSKVPLIGPFLMIILSPLFSAGYLVGARAIDRGDELEISHLFAGFQKNAPQLVTLGGIHLVATMIIVAMMVAVGGDASLQVPTGDKLTPEQIAQLQAAMPRVMTALLLALTLSVPLLMLVWYAPALIIFDKLPTLLALKASFIASWRNIGAFGVLGVVMLGLTIIAAIPFGLGFILLIPVFIASSYASYMDVFERQAKPSTVR